MISDAKRDQMNRLYRAAIDLRRAQLRFLDGVSARTLRDLQESGEAVGKLLVEISNGKDPVMFESKTASLCATAALIGGSK